MSTPRAVPVSPAEIARLAGVGRAAVSNWRRRHPSFPERIAGTDVNPLFSLLDIEQWLRENGKLKNASEREWLWPHFEALGGRDDTGEAIAEVGRHLAGPKDGEPAGRFRGETRDLIERAVDIGRREGGPDLFAFLLRRWLDLHVRQIITTPPPLASLMADLALATAGPVSADSPLIVMDPACGAGHLLLAAAEAAGRSGAGTTTLLGADLDPVLTALTEARLALSTTAHGSLRRADSLRDAPFAETSADLVLCNPPFNERDWGYEDLATDTRWSHGLPPRTEPELAWVQHCLAGLRPGGAAVVVLPPAVAARRAGRRIRSSLVRTGHLRAVVALPPGCAVPHSVSLQLWILRAPGPGDATRADDSLLVVDAASRFPHPSGPATRGWTPDWAAIGAFVRTAVEGRLASPEDTAYVRRVPVLDLLDGEVDLTPGRHIAPSPADSADRIAGSWRDFMGLTTQVDRAARLLAGLRLASATEDTPAATTVGELDRAGALTLRGGAEPAASSVRPGPPVDGEGIPLLTVRDLLQGGEPGSHLAVDDPAAGDAVLAEAGDIVVAAVAKAFSAWVHEGPPTVLGAQLYVVQVRPEQLDTWFLAGSLRAPSNARQAGTHTSSSSRVDVRRLQVRQLPLAEQRRYGAAFRELVAFERALRHAAALGGTLIHDMADELAAGRLTAHPA